MNLFEGKKYYKNPNSYYLHLCQTIVALQWKIWNNKWHSIVGCRSKSLHLTFRIHIFICEHLWSLDFVSIILTCFPCKIEIISSASSSYIQSYYVSIVYTVLYGLFLSCCVSGQASWLPKLRTFHFWSYVHFTAEVTYISMLK